MAFLPPGYAGAVVRKAKVSWPGSAATAPYSKMLPAHDRVGRRCQYRYCWHSITKT
jgi:hypothetical protein